MCVSAVVIMTFQVQIKPEDFTLKYEHGHTVIKFDLSEIDQM